MPPGPVRPLAASLALLALAVLTGCASKQLVHLPDQQVTIEDPEKGRIYVMRQPTFWRFNIVSLTKKIRVIEGGREIGFIKGQRGFLSWETEPGERIIIVPGEASLAVTVQRGKVHYIVVRDVAGGPYVGPGTGRITVELKRVDEKEGREELAQATPPNQDAKGD